MTHVGFWIDAFLYLNEYQFCRCFDVFNLSFIDIRFVFFIVFTGFPLCELKM
jgi:hypothetical protein